MKQKIKKYPNPNPNGKPLIDCPGCGKRVEHGAKGYCSNCYRRLAWKRKLITCKACGRKRPHKAFGLCGSCHIRLHHYEKTLRYNAMKHNSIELEKLEEITKKCVCCGFDKIVQLHHLDGNKENKSDGNMVGLCPNCHKMIHMYEFFEEIRQKLAEKGYNVSEVHPSNYANRRFLN
jgi:hypothetical protein